MKTILILALISTTIITHGQATLKTDIGTSTKTSFLVSMGFGYTYKNILAEGSITVPPLDQTGAVYFGTNAGYLIRSGNWLFTPLAGAAYKLFTTDAVKKNGNGFVANAGIRMQFKDAYFGVSRMDKTTSFAIGLFGIIGE